MDTAIPSTILAILEGGPETIPHASRLQEVGPMDDKIKIPHYGGYEHFERVGWLNEKSSAQHLIFRWITRTEVAE